MAILALGAFSFIESPQLQALLADITRPALRDASFATYFTVAFVGGAVWVAAYGAIVSAFGEGVGLRIVFATMAAASLLAALFVLPIRAAQRIAAVRAEEAKMAASGESRPTPPLPPIA